MQENQRPERLTRTIPEAARMIGVDEKVLRRAVAEGDVPSIKIGSRRLIPLRHLERMLKIAQEAAP